MFKIWHYIFISPRLSISSRRSGAANFFAANWNFSRLVYLRKMFCTRSFGQVFEDARVFMLHIPCIYALRNKFPCRVLAFTASFTVCGRARRRQRRFTKCGFTDLAPLNPPWRAPCNDHRGILSARSFVLVSHNGECRRMSFMSEQFRARLLECLYWLPNS